jgi:eukaryotic translation initiation factor 2C
MPGGAGARRGPPHLERNPYQGGQQGPPPGYGQQFNQYQAGPQPQQQYSGPPAGQQGPITDKPRSGGYDGPGEPSRGQNPYGPGLGYDPAKSQVAPAKVITNTRIDLPASAYKLEGGVVS